MLGVASLSLILLVPAGCGRPTGDIGAPGVAPADIPADSDASLEEVERRADEEARKGKR